MIVQAGATTDVINGAEHDLHANLIVLGGKHHSLLGRWLGGSTALNVARTTATPILVTAGEAVSVHRVLVALDTSGAAAPTLEAAHELARSHGAQLRALSIIEPLPVMPESAPAVDPAPYINLCRDTIDAELRPLVAPTGAELIVRVGPTALTIEDEAKAWHADLVVVGSHGKSWTQRLILGSVTERLLNDLPASLVVVPVGAREPAVAPAHALRQGVVLTAAIG
jgi:nucleotide-binding universal stress UspA family protein